MTRVNLKDDPETMFQTIARLHDANDTLILSGGVSMGQYDFVPQVLDTLGVELVFHRIEQRPGRPMWFGVSKTSKPIFSTVSEKISFSLFSGVASIILSIFFERERRRKRISMSGLPLIIFSTFPGNLIDPMRA